MVSRQGKALQLTSIYQMNVLLVLSKEEIGCVILIILHCFSKYHLRACTYITSAKVKVGNTL